MSNTIPIEIKLEGVIDENTNFLALIGEAEGRSFTIDCKGVKRINSMGVKSWMIFFQDFNSKNKVVFTNFSISLVEQLNSVLNFGCGATIQNIMVPYICQKCNKESSHQMEVSYLKKMTTINELPCPYCDGMAEFDDLPEEYFAFLEFLK